MRKNLTELVFRFRRFVGYKKKIKETLHAHTYTRTLSEQTKCKNYNQTQQIFITTKNHTLRFGCSQLCL